MKKVMTKPLERISLLDGKFISNVDGEIERPNLDECWTHRLCYDSEWDDKKNVDRRLTYIGKNSFDIEKEVRYSYINLCCDLLDIGFDDSCYRHDCVPSMIYRYNPMNEDDWIWIGFPNSNKLDEKNEEWNNFTVIVCRDTDPIEVEDNRNFVFNTIEGVLGFIESNKSHFI